MIEIVDSTDILKETLLKVHDLIVKHNDHLSLEKEVTPYSSYRPPVRLNDEHLVCLKLNYGILVLGIVEKFYYNTPDDSVSDWFIINDLNRLLIPVEDIESYKILYISKPSEKIIEKWECTSCSSKDYPCLIEIHSMNSELNERLDEHTKFRRRLCICDNTLSADWKQITELKEGE